MNTALTVCRLLGDAANGRAVNTQALPDEASLLGFCKVHRLETLVSSALRTEGVPQKTYAALHDAASKAAFHQLKNDLTTAAVLENLTTHGVHVLPLKGAALQAVYPDGWVRTATDLDVYLTRSRVADAAAVLTAMGFVQSHAQGDDICFQKPPRTVVELHTSLGGYSKKQRQTLDRLSRVPFTVNEHYVYTLFHLYKHVLYAGAGVRLFWDMYCLSRAVTDRDVVERWLKDLELLPFDRAVHTVNGILFDGDPCTDDMTEVIAFVMCSGTFGTRGTHHTMKQAARPVTYQRRFHLWAVDYGFDRSAMTARYPVLMRHRWLYLPCAIHRIVRGALFKRAVLRHAVTAEHAPDRKQLERVLKALQIL